jgi:hypothetical protein
MDRKFQRDPACITDALSVRGQLQQMAVARGQVRARLRDPDDRPSERQLGPG